MSTSVSTDTAAALLAAARAETAAPIERISVDCLLRIAHWASVGGGLGGDPPTVSRVLGNLREASPRIAALLDPYHGLAEAVKYGDNDCVHREGHAAQLALEQCAGAPGHEKLTERLVARLQRHDPGALVEAYHCARTPEAKRALARFHPDGYCVRCTDGFRGAINASVADLWTREYALPMFAEIVRLGHADLLREGRRPSPFVIAIQCAWPELVAMMLQRPYARARAHVGLEEAVFQVQNTMHDIGPGPMVYDQYLGDGFPSDILGMRAEVLRALIAVCEDVDPEDLEVARRTLHHAETHLQRLTPPDS